MFILDSHCDTPSQILRLRDLALDNDHAHVDFPKLGRGAVDAAFFALYIPASLQLPQAEDYAWKLMDGLKACVQANSDKAAFAYSSSDALRNKEKGLFSVFVGLENGSPIGNDLARMDEFHDAGVRYITLCHSADNQICDSCAPRTHTWNGLSSFGRELIARMNEKGMLIDVSHISDDAFYDVMKYSRKPVAATHSCCRALASHPRNMTDDMIRTLAHNGGVMQINFYPVFLDDSFRKVLAESRLQEEGERIEAAYIADPSNLSKRKAWYEIVDSLTNLPRPSYKRIVDHIDHAVSIAGIDHVGIGSDFDGIEVTPDGMEDISKIALVFEEMKSRGYSDEDIKKVAGGNFLELLDCQL